MTNKQFKKFEPATQAAQVKVNEFLARGGTIIKESRTKIEIKREQSIATVDEWGRVEWRSA